MGYVVGVYATRTSWVGVDCDMCGSHYSCKVEATGKGTDTFHPFAGEEDMKEMALQDLELALQVKAESYPCPQCGAYREGHANHVMNNWGKLFAWLLFLGITIGSIALICVVAPKTPVWSIFIIGPVAIIVGRVIGGKLSQKFDPNRNLEANRNFAQYKISNGSMRVSPPMPGEAPAGPPQQG